MYSFSLVLVLIFKNTCEREREVTPPTIHSVKLHWHLGIFNFILRLTLCKRKLQSFKSAATRNAKLVYYLSWKINFTVNQSWTENQIRRDDKSSINFLKWSRLKIFRTNLFIKRLINLKTANFTWCWKHRAAVLLGIKRTIVSKYLQKLSLNIKKWVLIGQFLVHVSDKKEITGLRFTQDFN